MNRLAEPCFLRSSFRARCPSSWPHWARRWAASKGSLTKRLVQTGKPFAVMPTRHGKQQVPRAQKRWLGQAWGSVFFSRRVWLLLAHQPVVAACTYVSQRGPRCDWSFIGRLGNRSLGSVLFSDPAVQRGRVHYKKLPVNSKWVKQLLGSQQAGRLAAQYRLTGWYVRGACFRKPPYHTPLWVFEVFLPTLQELKELKELD